MRNAWLPCLVLAIALFAPSVEAEIVKQVTVGCAEKMLCFYWWPRLPALKGWRADTGQSFKNGDNGVNMLVPDGSDFVHAGAVMYGEAIYKCGYEKTHPHSKTLEALIDDDKAAAPERDNEFRVREAGSLLTGDGQKLRSFMFTRSANWDRVSYGEEGDFYLVFTISATNEAQYKQYAPDYERLIASYRR